MPSAIRLVGEGRSCVNSMKLNCSTPTRFTFMNARTYADRLDARLARKIFVQQMDGAQLILGDP